MDVIRWELILPILIIELILIGLALFDWFRTKETNGPRWMWLLIILIINPFGPILYFLIGRKH
ncbi:PLD nuclease N-terminal domain-containing protein [Bacillus sp. Marseille-Q3570]|uniref:PLD nuclease N-terminal domain-containing protein n=1 Tax=Bacillus sp. Marseille-Q3570 TaxID=2963522 RepID=UPI0028DBB8E5|nr:PLD nuclease N-terminal domain-containing protein [Bacillus sp. Marseille-Q3570]